MNEKHRVNVGDRSGRLVVCGIDRTAKGIYLQCKCDCGKSKAVYKGNFVNGKSKSCGCYAKEVTSNNRKTHGKSRTRIYLVWRNMLNRCYNKKTDRYPSYGGRGVSVCQRWKKCFENFYADMGDIPSSKHTIGRVDNDGNYEPSNCRWEVAEQQSNNTSRNVMVSIDGVEMSVSQAAKSNNIPYSRLLQRAKKKVSGRNLLCDNLTRVNITVDGKTMPTTHWMKEAKIPISSFYHFSRKGLSKEDIVRKYLNRNNEQCS